MSSTTNSSQSPIQTPNSTPSTRRQRSLIDLTPRSKIKALLADSDDSEDDIARLISKGSEDNSETNGAFPRASNPVEGGLRHDDGEESEDDLNTITHARGRLASRIKGHGENRTSETESHHGELGTYERIKRELLAGRSKAAAGQDDQQSNKGACRDSEEFPVNTKKAGRRLQRQRPEASPSLSSPEPANKLDVRTSQEQAETAGNGARERSTSQSVRAKTVSPGLFVSPERRTTHTRTYSHNGDTDSDLPEDPEAHARVQALVARKREERKARENAKRKRPSKTFSGSDADSVSGDDEADQKLTQQARPTRRAGKKALEDMNRETQRLSRNMQLAHQQRTKKTITKESFFAKLNFNPKLTISAPAEADSTGRSNQTESTENALGQDLGHRSSDVEHTSRYETPCSSPPIPDKSTGKEFLECGPLNEAVENDGNGGSRSDQDLPSPGRMVAQTKEKLNQTGKPRSPSRGGLAHQTLHAGCTNSESEDELEIIGKDVSKRFDIFDHLPRRRAQRPSSFRIQRALANLTSPPKKPPGNKSNKFMTPGQLSFDLKRLASKQAQAEKAERLQDLRNRGIIVQTAEEREQDQIQLENLLEKARQENLELSKKEKEAAKREGNQRVAGDQLPDSDDEEDESWRGTDEELDQIENSGSESEDVVTGPEAEDEAEEEDEVDEDKSKNGKEGFADDGLSANLVEEEAVEDHESGSEPNSDDETEEPEPSAAAAIRRNRPNRRLIVEDDEDEEGLSEVQQSAILPPSPASAEDFSAFGFPDKPYGNLDMTQAFAPTMADSQGNLSGGNNMLGTLDPEQDSLAFLRQLAPPDLPSLAQSQDLLVADSQRSQSGGNASRGPIDAATQEISIDFTQEDTQLSVRRAATQWSEVPDPTQDVGFRMPSSPGIPQSTVETVLLHAPQVVDSPVVKKKSRLRRQNQNSIAFSDDEDTVSESEAVMQGEESNKSANAFEIMRRAAIKPPSAKVFDKKKSEAKNMVEEQAEESEDEYAGLGGASDEEDNGELEEELKGMIDESDVKVNERKLAALFADKERIADEKQIEKLYRDINNGGLRRKRGADFDLSDSEDDANARRRKKQLEFAKMRKALLEDENIGKIAENPKKSAFLRAIEDRDKDEEFEILDQPLDTSQSVFDSQTAQAAVPPIVSPSASLKRKRLLEGPKANDENRPPAHLRRTKKPRPSTLAEVRDSVSFLMEEPSIVQETQLSEGSEDQSDDENTNHDKEHVRPREAFADRRRPNPVIDRILLKRAASSADRADPSTTSLAFHAPSLVTNSGFRVPSLLRRGTTTASLKSNVDTETGGKAVMEAKEGIRRGGTKKSSVNYHVRETERRANVVLMEKRMQNERAKAGKMRRGILGTLGLGTFD